jgi:hypothetical protein
MDLPRIADETGGTELASLLVVPPGTFAPGRLSHNAAGRGLGMMKKLSLLAVAVAGLATVAAPSSAQFAPGYTGIGPTIGLGGIESANIAIGGRLEHGIKPLPELGSGTLAVEFSIDYYSWNCDGAGYTCRAKRIPFGATANYHFRIESNQKWDPFLGLGLGFETVSCRYSGVGNCGYSSGLYVIGRAGARYFFEPRTALYADLGAGAATLIVGVMWSLH